MRRVITFLAAAIVAAVAIGTADAASKMIVVPAGHPDKSRPEVDAASVARTKETRGTFEGKYKRVLALLKRDTALMADIKRISAIYGIDPVHVLGAIVAEHTFNVDAFDTAQGYYVKAMEYLGSGISFTYGGVSVVEFVARPEFDRCKGAGNDYDLWNCREQVWKTVFSGKTVDGVRYPKDRFVKVFFQPLYAGQTFGLGQLSPLTALMVSDVVERKGGLSPLDPNAAPAVYHAIMDPDSSLHYIAAVIRLSIDAYKAAGFDISQNPGLTATLYNVGDVKTRAAALAAANRRGGRVIYPEENYFGWFVNEKQPELEALL